MISDDLTPAQFRGARGMLGWTMFDLARAAAVSVSTVKRMERGEPQPLSGEIRRAVRGALEAAGVRFLGGDGAGAGVRLEPPQSRSRSGGVA